MITSNFRRAFALLFTFAFLGFASAATAQETQEARIIVVDFERVSADSLVGQDVNAQLESNRASLETRASTLDNQLSAEQDELARQRNIIAPDAFEERVRAFNQRRQDYQLELTQLNQQQQRAAQQASLEIARTLRPIILDLMREKGATMVLDRAVVYHTVGGLDVTTEVIERLDLVMSAYSLDFGTPPNGGNQ